MKRMTVFVLTIVSLTTLLLAPMASAAAAEGATIAVTSTGSVTIDPDMATVSIGVSISDEDAKGAQEKCDAAMDAIVAAIKELDIPDEQIKTENYYLNPNYDYTQSTPEVVSYSASHQLSVTVLDIGLVGAVIDTAVNAGANQSYGISFGVQDETAQYQQALEQAVLAAQPKADAIAAAAGLRIIGIASINESGANSPVLYRNSYAVPEATAMDMGVQSGTLNIIASITVIYAVE